MRHNKVFSIATAVCLSVGLIGHVLWQSVGGIPAEDDPGFRYATLIFYLTLIEIVGLGMLGVLILKLRLSGTQPGPITNALTVLIYCLGVLAFLILTHHPLSMTLAVFLYLLTGGKM